MRNSLKWAVAAASVLALSLVSVQQTGAAWRSEATLKSTDDITAGRLDITVGTGASGVKAYPFTALFGENMAATTYSQKPLVVFNSGNVGMKYRLTGVSQSNTNVSMNLSITQVANEAACPATGDPVGNPLVVDKLMSSAGASFALREVPKAAPLVPGTEVLCVRATMNSNAPDLSTNATLNFVAEVYR